MAKHRSSQEWKKLLSAYKKWNGSQSQFCVEHNISIASLHNHRRKQVQKAAGKQSPAVIELSRSKPVQVVPGGCAQPTCQIEYHHPEIGLVKVHCQANQLAMVVGQLSQDTKQITHDLS